LAVGVVNILHAGPAAARNAGAERARGDYLIFTDDDCLPDGFWLHTIDAELKNYPACMLGGKVMNYFSNNIFSETSQIVSDLVYAQYNPDFLNARFFSSNHIVLPRSDFLALGGFDEAHFPKAGGEDRDFCARWLASGRRMVYIESMVIHHAHDLSLCSFMGQYFAYGQGASRFYQMGASYPGDTVQIQKGYYRHFYARLAGRLKNQAWGKKIKIVTLLFLWQMANSAGFIVEYFRTLDKNFKP
jgi:GT2 family glycosyltransferase